MTRKEKPSPQREPQKPPLDFGDVTSGVSLIQERLIGRVVVQWSRVEVGLNELIWRMLKLKMEDGRVLTGRMDAQLKIAMLRKFAPNYMEPKPLASLLKALTLADDIRDDRNFIVHGLWATTTSDRTPIAASIRGKSGPGEVRAELFSHDRMRIVIRDIDLVRKSLEIAVNSFPSLTDI